MNSQDRLPRVDRSSMSERTYQILKESIFSKRFASGQKIDLSLIGSQMGVSRTPLNMALQRLAAEGLVEIVPRKGTFVTALSRRDIEESFDVRRVLEVYAIGLAAHSCTEGDLRQLRLILGDMHRVVDVRDRNKTYRQYTELDRAFHRKIVDCAGNHRLSEMWQQTNLHVQIARIRYRCADRDLDTSMAQHEGIVEAFPNQNVDTLQELLRQHIEEAKYKLLRDLDELQGS